MKMPQKTQLGMILLASFLLRFLAAWQKDFWFDEAITLSIARQSLDQLSLALAADNHPPLYFLFLHFWLKINQSEMLLRLPSIIFGLASIYLVYLIGKKLINQSVALFSAAIATFSPLYVYFSAEVRMYSLWVMLILLDFYLFLRILKNNPKSSLFLFYFFTLLLSLYTHYFTILLILSLNMFLFLNLKKYQRILSRLILLELVASLLFLPWLIYTLSFPHPPFWTYPPTIGIPTTLVSFVMGGLGQVTQKVYFLSPQTPLIIKTFFWAVVFLACFLFGMGLREKSKIESKKLLLTVFLIPILVVSFFHFFRPLYTPRAFVAFAFPFYIFIALGISTLSKRKPPFFLKVLVLALFLMIILIQNLYPPLKPINLKQARLFLKENAQEQDVLTHTSIYSYYSLTYYLPELKNQFLILPSDLPRPASEIIGGSPESLGEIKKSIKKERIWLMADRRGTTPEDLRKIKKELADYSLLFTREIGDLAIFLYAPTSLP